MLIIATRHRRRLNLIVKSIFAPPPPHRRPSPPPLKEATTIKRPCLPRRQNPSSLSTAAIKHRHPPSVPHHGPLLHSSNACRLATVGPSPRSSNAV